MPRKHKEGFLIVKGWDSYNRFITKPEIPDYLKWVRKQSGAKRLHHTWNNEY